MFNGHDGSEPGHRPCSASISTIFRCEMERVVDVDDDRVVVLLYQSGRIKGSGHTLREPLGVPPSSVTARPRAFDLLFLAHEALNAAGLAE